MPRCTINQVPVAWISARFTITDLPLDLRRVSTFDAGRQRRAFTLDETPDSFGFAVFWYSDIPRASIFRAEILDSQSAQHGKGFVGVISPNYLTAQDFIARERQFRSHHCQTASFLKHFRHSLN